MAETLNSGTVSTRLERIAEQARKQPGRAFKTLAHCIDINWLREAHQRTRKTGAPGVDGQSAVEFAEQLDKNLQSLLDRAKSGTYRAPPVRRVHIPKGKGDETRPIGIPTFEDKVLQRAVAMVLEAVYEQDFKDCSYGFRPRRSAHGALEDARNTLMEMKGGWVLEVDIRKFFDTLDHGHLRSFLRKRVLDGVLLRLIGKWLRAGVLEDGNTHFPETGSPQGGVISPLLANVFLHEVLDIWFEQDIRPKLRGAASMVRYADDAVLVFALEADARRVMAVLPKRFEKYGLTLHPDKTRIVDFRRPNLKAVKGQATFDLLGFTHYWGRSRAGSWVVKRKTAKERFRRGIRVVAEWCRQHLHNSLSEQQRKLSQKLIGHYSYFGITSNFRAISKFYECVVHKWRFWLDRRSHKAHMNWERMQRVLKHYPLPMPRIMHSYCFG